MDTRRILTTVLIFTVIFFGFNYITNMWAGKKADVAATQAVTFAPALTQPAAMEDGANDDAGGAGECGEGVAATSRRSW